MASAFGRRRCRSAPRPPREPVDGSLGCRRLRKWSNVGIGDHRFVDIKRAVAVGAAAQGYITKVFAVPGAAGAEISHQSRAIENAVDAELQ